MADKIFKSLIDVHPKTDFNNGISLNFSIQAGIKGKEIFETLPEYFQNNPITFSLELGIEDPDQGPLIVQTLEGVKEMAMGLIPNAEQLLGQGILIKFRHVGKSIFIDVSVEGMFAEMVNAQLKNIQLDLSQFSESGEFHLISGLRLDKPLDTSYEELVKQASQFKVQGQGELPLKLLVETILGQVTKLIPLGETEKRFLSFIAVLKIFRSLKYTVEYDSEEMLTNIKELAGIIAHNTMGGASMDELNPEIGSQMIGTVVSQGQEVAKVQLEGIKQMASAFLEPYKDSISQLNLDNIGFSLVYSQYQAIVRVNFCPVGVTEFIRTNILS